MTDEPKPDDPLDSMPPDHPTEEDKDTDWNASIGEEATLQERVGELDGGRLTLLRKLGEGDFGLAGVESAQSDTSWSVPTPGAMLGTLFYAAPEQVQDASQADERSDIYSLAATLYFCLTGQSPKTLRFARLPKTIRPILEKAFEEVPANRYASVGEFAAAWEESAGRAGRRFAVQSADCPKCRAENPITARFCLGCGQDLSELFKKCPQCQADHGIDQEFCAACGSHIPSATITPRLCKPASKALPAFPIVRYSPNTPGRRPRN